jgi:hypothetical protein
MLSTDRLSGADFWRMNKVVGCSDRYSPTAAQGCGDFRFPTIAQKQPEASLRDEQRTIDGNANPSVYSEAQDRVRREPYHLAEKQKDTAYLWGGLTYRVLSSEAFSKFVEIQARI